MAITIVYTVECQHCGGDATSRTLAFDQPEPDGTVTIDVELSIGQTAFTCEGCGCTAFIGDVLVEHDDRSCTGDPEDEEDETLSAQSESDLIRAGDHVRIQECCCDDVDERGREHEGQTGKVAGYEDPLTMVELDGGRECYAAHIERAEPELTRLPDEMRAGVEERLTGPVTVDDPAVLQKRAGL